MAKKFVVDKLEIEEVDKLTECVECLNTIRTHTNYVMGMFEVHANELFENFDKTAKSSMLAIEAKSHDLMIEHFKKQELKEDQLMIEQHEKQSLKYNVFENKIFILIKWFLMFFGAVALICSTVVGITWVNVQNKANKNDVLTLKDAKIVIDLGDKYRDQRYVLRSGETIDKYNYQWMLETVFARASRGEETKTRLEDELKTK